MTRSIVTVACAMLLGMPALSGAASRPASPAFARADARSFFDTYCVTCHNDRLETAGLSLAGVDLTNVEPHVETLEKVLRRLQQAAMPPAGSRRPAPAE